MFSIMHNKYKFMALSVIVVICGIIGYIMHGGFRYDIDFSGGTMMQIDMEKSFDNNKVAEVVKRVINADPYSVQKVGAQSTEVMIKMPSLSSDKRQELFNEIKKEFSLKAAGPMAVDNVSPAISKEIVWNATKAVVIALALILIYITIRFEFLSGISAIFALVHDVLIMLSVYAIFQVPVNSSFIAAMLTVIGYSNSDTIIVFDRIRENRRYIKKESFENIAESSIWQTMRRSLNTTGATIVPLVILQFMGVTSIKEFAFPLIIGIISGAYSSIFIASPIWVLMRGDDKKPIKARAAR